MPERFKSPCPLPTPYEREILTILIEECAEVQQRATKLLRFGRDEVQSGQNASNTDRLSDEICDLMALINLCEEAGLIRFGWTPRSTQMVQAKRVKVRKYLQSEPQKVEADG